MPKPGPNGPHLAEFGRIWPDAAPIATNFAKVWQISAKVGPSLVDVSQIRQRFGQSSALGATFETLVSRLRRYKLRSAVNWQLLRHCWATVPRLRNYWRTLEHTKVAGGYLSGTCGKQLVRNVRVTPLSCHNRCLQGRRHRDACIPIDTAENAGVRDGEKTDDILFTSPSNKVVPRLFRLSAI